MRIAGAYVAAAYARNLKKNHEKRTKE